MNIKARSIVVVTSVNTLHKHSSEINSFFDKTSVVQKDFIIYSPKPIMDYTTIQKMTSQETIIIYQKDFWPMNIALKPLVQNTLHKKQYDLLIHYNTDDSARSTYLISKSILAALKISNIFSDKKLFSVIIQSEAKFFDEVMQYAQKIVW